MSEQTPYTNDTPGAVPWEPARALRSMDPNEVRLSRGLLRCRPEKWFPGVAAYWMPLAHSLGLTVKVSEVKAMSSLPADAVTTFVCSVDEEPLGIILDESSTSALLDAVVPGALPAARSVVAEYIARRLLTSLAASWSGPESSVVRFESEMNPDRVRGVASIKVAVKVNSDLCALWIVLGPQLADRLDGLWRRQLRSSARQASGRQELRMELVELAVPPTMLVDYLNPGSLIDLETPIGDTVTLRLGNKPWMTARLFEVNGNLGFEVLPGPVAPLVLPEGTTRLAVEFGVVEIDSAVVQELAQPGACWDTGLSLSDRVQMVINNERVADARLCCFQGRFAVNVG